MVYLTTKYTPKTVQLKFEDILFGNINEDQLFRYVDKTRTVTRCLNELPEGFEVNVNYLIRWLACFNERNEKLFNENRQSLYHSFKIPKAKGGMRQIDEPCPELQNALGDLAYFFQEICQILYHTSAYAYIKNRCTLDAVKKHADFKSNWFLKTDVSGFFPNTTLDFTMRMLSMVYPLSEVVKVEEGREHLRKAVSLGFLNGGLPQGTRLSPCLTNIICIPLDHYLSNMFANKKMVYTRYADDMLITARENFPWKKTVETIMDVFKRFDAPYQIKNEKTRYGSVKGSNWNLGLMLNGQYNITVGYKNKARFKAMVCDFVVSQKNGKPWNIDDVEHLIGLLSYYRMIEKDYFNEILRKASVKWGVDVEEMMKARVRAA